MILHNTLAVFRFEFRRTVTASRLGVWLLLVFFPVFIVSVMKYYEGYFDFGRKGFGGSQETLTTDSGARIDIKYRHGQRVATIRLGPGPAAPKVKDVPIPKDLSTDDIKQYVSAASFGELALKSARAEDGKKLDDTVWGWILLGLIPGVITLLGLLLWVTPLVQAELEGRTWGYLAVHPRGRASLLLGKYLTAMAWTGLAGWTSLTICILIAQPAYPFKLWNALALMVGFSCLGYGALYSLIAVLAQRRAMVIAVAYTLILEFLVSFIPAVINQFTVLFRLRNLFVRFMDWQPLFAGAAGYVFVNDQSTWLHILILAVYTVTLLVVALQVIQYKEYIIEEEV